MRASTVLTIIFPLLLSAQAAADGTPIDDGSVATPQAPAVQKRTVVSSGGGQAAADVLEVKPPRTIQVYASDDTAEVLYERSGSVLNFTNSRASVGFLFNEQRDNVISGSIMYDVEPKFFTGFALSFGTKAFAGLLGIEDADVIGLGVNLEAAYSLPVRQFPLKLSTALAYAPDILTFGQSDRIIDWNIRAGLKLTDKIDGFVGFRFLQFDTRPGERELDEEFHIGIRWKLAD